MNELRQNIKESFGKEFEELGKIKQAIVVAMVIVLVPVGMVYGYYLNRRNLAMIKKTLKKASRRMDRINISQERRDRVADEFEEQIAKYIAKINGHKIQDDNLADIDRMVNDIINQQVYM